ncbi:unnamed protein product [Brachionus calyciflorus]|uniref:CBM21 domain-containing protein n=1 Tax=Brachionus calyciflorus TaxID=104777 RepID=A0A814HHJ9_9BILA|nr:unnamed protein product [Brachionus calyciflorus]
MYSLDMLVWPLSDDFNFKSPKFHTKIINDFSYLIIKFYQLIFSSKYAPEENSLSKRKKSVQFADSLGLELATVIIESDNDLDFFDESQFEIKSNAQIKQLFLQPLFEQPGLKSNFISCLNENKVLLEITNQNHSELSGFIRVLNLSNNKRAFIRCTIDNWKSHFDLACNFVPSNSNLITEKFSFLLTLEESLFEEGFKLEFAVCYEIESRDIHSNKSKHSYWDNNNGQNYKYECVFKTISI